MKRLVSLVLAAMLLLSLMPAAMADGVKEIDVMVWYRDVDDLNFAEMAYYNDPENGITAQSGVKANFNQVKGADWSTKLNLALAGGNYPDIIMRGDIDLEMYGVDEQVLIPLDDAIEKYMPNYKALLDADPALAASLTSSDGKMYQIGWLIPQNINTESHLFINKQWLDNLDLAVPTTIEEFEQVLVAFRDQDADGDGDPSNEIPFGGPMMPMEDGMLHLLSFWGIPYNNHYASINDEGKVYSWLTSDAMRDAMETIHRWYDEGLIDMESVTQDVNSSDAKVNSGKVGSFWRWRLSAMGTDEAIYSQYVCVNPFAAEGYTPKLSYYLEVPVFGAAITVDCEDVEAACKWLDTQLEWENMINGYNGMRGEFWDYDAEGKVDIWPMTDGTRTVPGQSSMYYCSGEQYFAAVNMPPHRIEKSSYCEAYTAAGLIEKNSWQTLTKLVTFTVDESIEIDLRFADVDKYAQEAISSFIVKGVTDDGWNTYLKTFENIQLDGYLQLLQGAYDRYVEANAK